MPFLPQLFQLTRDLDQHQVILVMFPSGLVVCYQVLTVIQIYTVFESEKLDPFSFLQKFGKYCPVLIFLLLLQTELNCSNEKGSSFYFSQCRMCLCIVYLLLSVGPGEENEDWTAKFCKVISERLGMATGG